MLEEWFDWILISLFSAKQYKASGAISAKHDKTCWKCCFIFVAASKGIQTPKKLVLILNEKYLQCWHYNGVEEKEADVLDRTVLLIFN